MSWNNSKSSNPNDAPKQSSLRKRNSLAHFFSGRIVEAESSGGSCNSKKIGLTPECEASGLTCDSKG